MMGTVVVGYTGVEFGRALVSAARRWPLPALLVGLVGGYFLFAYWQSERGPAIGATHAASPRRGAGS
jgi:hypothetical protein